MAHHAVDEIYSATRFPGPGTGPGAIRGIPGPGPRAQGCHTGESRHAIKDLVNIGTAWYGRGKQARREIAARNTVRRFMFFLWRQALRYKALLRVLFSRWRLRNSALREDARGGRAGPNCSSLVCACSLVVWAPGPRAPDPGPAPEPWGTQRNFEVYARFAHEAMRPPRPAGPNMGGKRASSQNSNCFVPPPP